MKNNKGISKKVERIISNVKNPLIKSALIERKDEFIFSGLFGKRDRYIRKHEHMDTRDYSEWGRMYYQEGNEEYAENPPSNPPDPSYDDHIDNFGTTINKNDYQDGGYI